MPAFSCQDCGKKFVLSDALMARYPSWTPRQCQDCRSGRVPANEPQLDRQAVLRKFSAGPDTGVFTDGFCEPNPGYGGWGAVKVVHGQILKEAHGHEDPTTNNRMELRALIEGFKMLDPEEVLPVYTDSQLCVNTITLWAAGWAANGWTRGKKHEPVMNLDLVKELYELALSRPKTQLQWIKGHAGLRWNEYADALSRAQFEPA